LKSELRKKSTRGKEEAANQQTRRRKASQKEKNANHNGVRENITQTGNVREPRGPGREGSNEKRGMGNVANWVGTGMGQQPKGTKRGKKGITGMEKRYLRRC